MIRYKHLSATGTGTIIGGPNSWPVLWSVNVNTAAGSAVLKIYNGTSASGELVASIDASGKGSFVYGVAMKDGIFYDLSGGNADVTIGVE